MFYEEINSSCSSASSSSYVSSTTSCVDEYHSSDEIEAEWKPDHELPGIPFTNTPHMDVGKAKTPYDYFQLLFNDKFMNTLLSSINKHAEIHLNEPENNTWNAIDLSELKVFLSLLIYMPRVVVHKLEYYWNTHPLYNFQFYKFMSLDRFRQILANLTFLDPTLEFSDDDPSSMYTTPILNFFNDIMQTMVVPAKDMVIDKNGLLGKKVRLHLFSLITANGMTQKMLVGSRDPEKLIRDDVVLTLMENYLDCGYSLYMDKYFTNIDLAEDLIKNGILMTGILPGKSNNLSFTKVKLKRGEYPSKINSSGLCVTTFKSGTGNISIISSEHSGVVAKNKRGKVSRKPKAVLEYNKFARMLEERAEQLAQYPSLSKAKWYVKFLVYVMNTMVLNSYIMYKQTRTQRGKKVKSYYDFQYHVVKKLIGVVE